MTGVSYVTTVYNKAAVLPEVIRSIIGQRGDFQREYIFVDDQSTDDSAAILQAHATDNPMIKVIRRTNGGPAAALNTGIAASTMPFVKGQDGDDLLHPDATQVLLDAHEITGCDAVYGAGVYYKITDPSPLDNAAPLSLSAYEIQPRPVQEVLQGRIGNPSGWLVKRSAFGSAPPCDPDVFIQDVSMPLRLAAKCDFCLVHHPVCFNVDFGEDLWRMSDNQRQILHDVCLAQANFLKDFPDAAKPHRWWIARKAVGRAWKWAKRRSMRHLPTALGLKVLLLSRLGEPAQIATSSCKVFGDEVRRPVP